MSNTSHRGRCASASSGSSFFRKADARACGWVVSLIVCAAIAAQATAATVIWDPAQDLSNSGGTGTWNLTTTNWNGGTDVVWPNAVDTIADFQGTGGTVTINTGATPTGVTANALTFDVNGYIVQSNAAGDVLKLDGSAPTIAVINSTDTATINAIITGTSGLTLGGSGTLALGGVNTYTGATTINTGTLKLLNGAAVTSNSAVTIGSGVLDVNGKTATIGSLAGSGVLALGAGSLTTGGDNSSTTFSGNITGTAASTLIKNGNGNMILNGDQTGFLGSVVVNSGTAVGTLTLQSGTALTAGTVTLNNTTVTGGTGTVLSLDGVTINGVGLVMNTDGTNNHRVTLASTNTTSVWNGSVTLNGNGLAQFNSAGDLTVGGNVGGAGFTGTMFLRGGGTGTITGNINLPTGILGKTEASTWTIASPSQVIVSSVFVADGTLKLGSTDILPTTIPVTIGQASGTSGNLDLNGFNQTFTGLQVATGSTGTANRITNSGGGNSVLTIGNNTTDYTFTGALGATGASNLALVKNGTNTQTLSAAGVYSGGTTINAGKIIVTNVGALGTGDATVNLNATLETNPGASGALTNSVIFNGGSFQHTPSNQLSLAAGKVFNLLQNTTINVVAPGPGGKVLLTGGQFASDPGKVLTKIGAGDLQLSGANPNFFGSAIVNGGQLEFQNPDSLGSSVTTVTVNTGGEFVTSGAAVRHNFTLAGGMLSANANGGADFTGTLTLAPATTSTFGLRFFQSLGTPGQFKVSGNLTGTGDLSVTGAGNVLQANASLQPGVASVLLTGNNTGFSGNLTINTGGQVRATMDGATNPLGSAPIIFSGGTLGVSPIIAAAGANSGIYGRWYNSALIGNGTIGGFDFGLATVAATRTETSLVFSDLTQAAQRPAGVNGTNFGVLWTGILSIGTGGAYTFSPNSDDGTIIYVDGQEVVGNDTSAGGNTRGGIITLSPGLHPIIIKYGQGGGGANITAMNYSGPDTGGTATSLGSSLTNDGATPFPATTFSNNITVSPNFSGTLDLAGTSVTNNGTITIGNGGIFSVTGVTGYETLTQNANVSITGLGTINTGIPQVTNGRALASAGADMVMTVPITETTPGSRFMKTGPRTLTLNAVNTYTGLTTLADGLTQLNATGGPALPGDVVLQPSQANSSVTMKFLASDQLLSTAKVTMVGINGAGGSTIDLNGFNQSLPGLTIINNQATGNNTVQTAGGTLTLTGDLTVQGISTGANAITGNLNLGGASRNFNISGASNTNITAVVSNGAIVKNGLGTLTLGGANTTWADAITVNQGKLSVTNVSGLGVNTAATTVNSGGYLDIVNLSIDEPLTIKGIGQPIAVTGTNNYSLQTSGAIQGSGGFAAALTGPITLAGNSAVGVPAGSLLTISSTIADGGSAYSLSKVQGSGAALIGTGATTGGPGILKLTGANTYTGATIVRAGDLWLANPGGQAIQSTSIVIGDGTADAALTMVAGNGQFPNSAILTFANGSKNAKFQLNGTTQTVAGFNVSGSLPIIQNHENGAAGAGTLIVNNPADTKYNGYFRDQNSTLALTKQGAGTFTLAGDGILGTGVITYTGSTTINDGKLVLKDVTAFASPITLVTGGAPALEFNLAFGRTQTYAKVLTDNGLGFTKTGAGTLILNQANAVGGTVNIAGGVLSLQEPAAPSTVNALSGAPINVAAGAQLQFNGNNAAANPITFNNNVTLNGLTFGGALAGAVIGGTPDNTLSGTLTLNATSNVSTGWSDKTFRITGQITGPGGIQFDKMLFTQNQPIFSVTNTVNNYGGPTIINAGTVWGLVDGQTLPTTSALSFGGTYGGGQIGVSGGGTFTRAIGTGAGQVAFGGDGGGFHAQGGKLTVTFGGATPQSLVWGGPSGTPGLATNASLFINNGLQLGAASVNNADSEVEITNDIDLAGSHRILVTNNNARLSGALTSVTAPGALIKDGTGVLYITGATGNTNTGLTEVIGGTLRLNKSSGVAIAGNITMGCGAQSVAGGRITELNASEQIADAATLSFAGANSQWGYLKLMGFNETVSNLQGREGFGVIEFVESETTLPTGGNAAGSVLTISGNTDSFFNGYVRDKAGGANPGTLSLFKSGAGTLTFSASNTGTGSSGQGSVTYTGPTTISGGRLALANLSAFNSVPTIASGAQLEFIENLNQSLTFGKVIGGAGDVIKSGAGTVVLNQVNDYAGTTTINGGTLQITSTQTGNHLGSYTVNSGGTLLVGNGTTAGALTNNNNITVGANGTVAFSRNNALAYSGIISGAGNVEGRTGGGVITLSGANTYSGLTTVNGGTIILGGNAASAGGLVVNTGAILTLDFAQPGSATSNLVASGAPVTLTGGTLNINASATNSQALGAVTVNPGMSSIVLNSGGGTLNASFGAFTHLPGGLLTLTLPASGAVTTTSAGVGGILGGFVTTGGNSTWVARDGLGNLSALAAYTPDTWDGSNIDVTTSSTQAPAVTANSLRFNTAAASTVTLSGINTLTSGGILVTSNVGNNASLITGGTLKSDGLTILQYNTASTLTIDSIIADNTGAASLSKGGAGTVVLTGANTYTGPTVVSQGQLISTGSLGTGPASTLAGATLQIGDGVTSGTLPKFGTNLGTFTLNNSSNQTISLPFNADFGFNTTTNSTANPTSFQNGTFIKTGPGLLFITNALLASQFHPQNGATLIDTGGNVNVGSFTSVGRLNGDVATLFIRNLGREIVNGDYNLGDLAGSRGTVTVQNAGLINARTFYIGKGSNTASATTIGLMTLKDLAQVNVGGLGNGGDWKIGGNAANDTGSYGALNIQGAAAMTYGGNFQVGAYGAGVINQTGGTLSVGGFASIARWQNAARGLYNISGGVFNQTAAANRLIVGETGAGVLNVGLFSGNPTPLAAGQVILTGGLELGGATSGIGTGIVNLGVGGLIRAGVVGDQNAENVNSPSILNFHGGILQPTAASTAFMGSGTATNANGTLTGAIVWPEGAVIDTNGFNITASQVFTAPTGSGVNSIPLLTGGAGYVSEPIVQITGDGTGATARAIVTGGVISNIIITNPGTGYTTPPTVTLVGGGATSPATLDPTGVSLASNANTGGFTKRGAGVLTLTATGNNTVATGGAQPHTWGGPTAVTGGGLTLDFSGFTSTTPADMISNASPLQLGGGTLTVTGHPNATAITTATGTTTLNSQTVTVNSSTGMVVGQSISGTNIPAGAVITSVVNATTITISAPATAAGATGALTLPAQAFTTSQTFPSTTLNPGASGVVGAVNGGGGVSIRLGAITRTAGSAVDFTIPASVTITTPTANTGTSILGGWATVAGANWAVSAGNGSTPGNITALGAYTNDTWAAANNTTVTANSTQTGVTTNSLRFNNAGAFTVTVSGADVITTGGILVTSTVGNNASTITGGTSLAAGTNNDLVVSQFNTANTLTIATPIIANGTGGLVKAGGGVLTLSSGTNAYTGNTIVGAGTLRVGNAAAIPSGAGKGDVFISAGATLDLNQLSPTINGLNGLGTVTVQTAPSGATTYTLTVGSSGTSSIFTGAINNNGNAVIALTKTGAGTLVMNNPAAGTYTGATNINGGAIDLATPLALSNNTAINVNTANGLLFETTLPTISGLGGNSNFALTTTPTAPVPTAPVILSVGNNNAGGTYTGALTGSGTLVKIGTGMQTLAGNNTNSGGVIVNAGTLVLGGNNSGTSANMLVAGGILQVNTPTSLYGTTGRNLMIGNGAAVTIQAPTANPTSNAFGAITPLLARIDQGSTGALLLQTDGSLQAPVNENLDFAAAGLNVSLGSVLTANSGTGTAPVQYTGIITPNNNTFRLGGGNGRLILPNAATLSGAGNSLNLGGGGNNGGTVYLTGAYSYGGSTLINSGISPLVTNLANGGVASSIGASTSAASNLVLNGGTLWYIGNGSTTDRLFTVSTSGGTLDSSGSAPVNFTNTGAIGFLNAGNRTLTLTGANAGANTLAAAIGDAPGVAGPNGTTGNGVTTLVKSGNGTWVLSGSNTFSGGVTINNGVLLFANAGAFGANSVNGPASVVVGPGDAAALGSAFTGSIQSALNRISPTSTGTVALTADTAESINLSGSGAALPTAFLGAYGNVTYTGALTPFGTVYRFGGGGGVLTLPSGGLTGPRQVLIGGGGPGTGFANSPNLSGAVVLGGTSDFSGGTVLAAGGVLSATNVAALGTGPLKFQGGVYRAIDSTDITLASDGISAREIRIGTEASNNNQTANIDVANGVSVTFSKTFGLQAGVFGANQGFEAFTKYGGGTLTLANGLNIAGANAAAINTGVLTVERGTLVLGANPTFFGGLTQIGSNNGGAGTLKLGASNFFASGPQFGSGSVIDTYNGSTLDLNGFSDTVRLIRGYGGISNTGAPGATLTVGTNNENGAIAGPLSGNFNLVRTGTVTNLFGTGAAINSTEIWNTRNLNFTGKIAINGGAIRVRADGVLGSPTEPFAADKITISNNATLLNLGNPVVIGPNHGITLGAGGGTIWAYGTAPFIINAPISGTGPLTLADDTGALLLGSDNNTWSGGTIINSNNDARGFLSIGAGGATGSLPAGDVFFNAPTGAGNVGGRLYFFKSTDMTVPNNINGPGIVLQVGAGTTTVTGNNTTNKPVWIGGGTLKADFSTGNTPVSIGAAVNINGGNFEFVAPAGTSTTRLGNIGLGAFTGPLVDMRGTVIGDSAVQSDYNGSGVQNLVFGSISRPAASSTLNFITNGGVNGVTNSISIASGLTPNSVIGSAWFFGGSDFAAFDASGFVRAPIYGFDTNTAAPGALTGGRFSKLSSAITGQAAIGVPAINFAAGSGLTMNASAALTINGNPGGLLKSGGDTSVIAGAAGATLNNNGQELIVRTDTSADTLRIDIPIAGAGQLTKGGPGQLTLTAANTYTGITLVNNGSILVTGNGVIGSSTGGEIRIANAAGSIGIVTIDSAAASISTGNAANAIRIGEGGAGTFNQSAGTVNAGNYLVLGENLGSTGAYNMTGGTLNVKTNTGATPAGGAGQANLVVGRAGVGTFNIGGNAVVNIKNGAQFQIAAGTFNSAQVQGLVMNTGTPTGVGTVNQTGGTVNVDVNNGAYQSNLVGGVIVGVDGSGTYNLNGGTLVTPILARGHGSAAFNLGGGTLKAASPVPTLPVSIFNLDLPITLTGTAAGRGAIDTNGNDATVTSVLAGAGGFIKAGAGTLTVVNPSGTTNSYAGGTDISAGNLVAAGNALGSGSVNVGATGTLTVQGLQQGLLARFYLATKTDMNAGLTNANVNMSPEFATLDNFNAWITGKPMVAAESTAARGKVGVNYLDLGGANQNTALPPALIATQNGSLSFVAHLSGSFNAPTAGDYTFQTRSDDGSMLWVDGQTVLDSNRSQGQTIRTGTINLSAGPHDIVIGYYQGGGGGGFSAGVTMPGQGQSFQTGELNLYNALLNYGSSSLNIGSLTGSGAVQLGAGTLVTGSDNTDAGFSGTMAGDGGGLTKTGTGTQTIAGGTYTGPTSVTGGRLVSTGSLASAVSVATGATFEAGPTTGTSAAPAPISVNGLALGSAAADAAKAKITSAVTGGTVLITPTLSLTGSGSQLDVDRNGLVLNYDGAIAGESALRNGQVRQWIKEGRNTGNWDGATGITSKVITSTTAADFAVGYKDSSSISPTGGTFMGQAVDGSSVLVRYTMMGDSNLDGVVNFIDLVAVAQNYNTVGTGTWQIGDFNYDNDVNFIDLVAVAQHYNQGLPTTASIPGAAADFQADWNRALAIVPEPGTLSLLALGALLVLRRRNRRAA